MGAPGSPGAKGATGAKGDKGDSGLFCYISVKYSIILTVVKSVFAMTKI